MKHPTPDPPELGERDGLSYALFLPECRAHGRRGDPARRRIREGEPLRLRPPLPRLRHGGGGLRRPRPRALGGRVGPDRLRRRARHVRPAARARARRWRCAARAWAASPRIHAAALDPSVAAVVAICPAPGRPAAARRALGPDRATSRSTPCRRAVARDGLDPFEAVAALGDGHRPAAAPREGRRAGALHDQRGAARGRARAQAPAGLPRRPPPLAAARPGGPEPLGALHRAGVRGAARARARPPRPRTRSDRALPVSVTVWPSSGFTPPTVWPRPSVTPWVVLPRPLVTPLSPFAGFAAGRGAAPAERAAAPARRPPAAACRGPPPVTLRGVPPPPPFVAGRRPGAVPLTGPPRGRARDRAGARDRDGGRAHGGGGGRGVERDLGGPVDRERGRAVVHHEVGDGVGEAGVRAMP